MPRIPWVVNGTVRAQRQKPREPGEEIQVSPGPAFSKEVQLGGRLSSGIQRKSEASRKEVSSLRNGTVKAQRGSAVAHAPLTPFPTLSSLFHPLTALVPTLLPHTGFHPFRRRPQKPTHSEADLPKRNDARMKAFLAP